MDLWRNFRKCYEKRALDNIEEKIIGRQKRIAFSIKLLPTKRRRILDLGSADGLLLETLHARNAIGSDISIEYCRKMKKKGIEVVNCASEYIPFADKTFDTIICTEVLEHVLYPSRVIEEIHRALNDQGYVLLSVPYMEDLTAYEHCEYDFAHLRSFDETFIHRLSESFHIISVSFYAFRVRFIKHIVIRNHVTNKILSDTWKFFARLIRQRVLREISRYVKPNCILTLARAAPQFRHERTPRG